jgi:hypothetical protein
MTEERVGAYWRFDTLVMCLTCYAISLYRFPTATCDRGADVAALTLLDQAVVALLFMPSACTDSLLSVMTEEQMRAYQQL